MVVMCKALLADPVTQALELKSRKMISSSNSAQNLIKPYLVPTKFRQGGVLLQELSSKRISKL